jgi:hypothetical protein
MDLRRSLSLASITLGYGSCAAAVIGSHLPVVVGDNVTPPDDISIPTAPRANMGNGLAACGRKLERRLIRVAARIGGRPRFGLVCDAPHAPPGARGICVCGRLIEIWAGPSAASQWAAGPGAAPLSMCGTCPPSEATRACGAITRAHGRNEWWDPPVKRVGLGGAFDAEGAGIAAWTVSRGGSCL